MKTLQAMLAAVAIALLSACGASNLPSVAIIEMKTYLSLSASNISGKSFDIVIVDENQRGSLEFKEHSDRLASYLVAKGMVRKKTGNVPADYTVFFLFSIAGRERTSSRTIPHFNVTGGTSNFNATTYGNRGTYNTYGTVTTYPTLQYAGSSTRISSYTEYTRTLIIRMYNADGMSKKDGSPVFETTALSEGTSRDTTVLVPLLLDALLFDFPGVSGKSDTQERLFPSEEQ